MAIKTMSAGGGGGEKFKEGWHEVEISGAEYGTYEAGNGDSKKYIDVLMKDYPENMNIRVYETFNNTTKEEFKIANLFKHANAGIVGVLKDPNGKNPLIQYDDDTKNLVGKTIQVYIYKEQKTGNEYSRVFDTVAPIAQEGEHLSFSPEAVGSIKNSIIKQVEKKLEAEAKSAPATTSVSADDIPF